MEIGSLVELVDDRWHIPAHHFEIYPIKNTVYTVREIYHCSAYWLVRLEELVNPKMEYSDGYREIGFIKSRFREVLPPIENVEEHINQNTLEICNK